ncbi:hypothetical protein BJ322DRAFT_309455 [Thelephora terrestris]|uniref:Uncharacterized protein n=1 Tax=Thelephora terrestris TaxID=56493 RepID=A0A9P6H6H4_9AGAM|nr:hypothetical protein BJ322DRAFT_309455 [Thelephora terrestris]
MKALRKSLGSTKDHHSSHHISTPITSPTLSKVAINLPPPTRVIRATSGYRSQAPQQLSFEKGDFFHVIRDIDNQGLWYEAHNPTNGARGLVPRSMFEEFSKGNPTSRASTFGSSKGGSSPTSPTLKTPVFYAVVQHDFIAERPDELEARAGDPISVVAQSNREWFVAKPIGRLGRPGLIPISFVEVRDPKTNQPIRDVNALLEQGALPRVEEWKRQLLNYKATSISLGVLDESTIKSGVSNSPFMPRTTSVPPLLPPTSSPPQPAYTPQPQPQPTDETQSLPEGILLSAEVVSFHSEMEEYWFRVHTVFQPYDPDGTFDLPSARQHVLYRCYNDFYDFQIELLEKFPREAGREVANQKPSPRLIPYMPGPVEHVDDEITLTRKDELDKYLRALCKLKETSARYILESVVVRNFLAIKPGDAEMELEPCIEEIQTIFGAEDLPDGYSQEPPHDDTNGLHDQMDRMNLNGGYDNGYEDRSSRSRSNSRAHDPFHNGDVNGKQPGHYLASKNHQRTGSAVSGYSSSPGNSPQPAPTKPQWAQNHPYSGRGWDQSNTPDYEDHFGHEHGRTPSVTSATSQPLKLAVVSRSLSQSGAAKLNSPPISANNPQTAFVKIKIFDSVTDDLIAIRVHPRVTHAQLMEKVLSRLGGNVKNLRYRRSAGGDFVELLDDNSLRSWLETTERHVLYAD